MEVYSNENEQVDALKNFFAQNGKALVVGVVLGVGALLGWRYWSHHQDSGSREVSASYQQVTSALDASKPASLDAVAKFASENSNTYGALASLDLAKRYIDNNQLDKAVQQLQSGLKSTKDANLQAVLNLRLARIQLQQKQPDAVLKPLKVLRVMAGLPSWLMYAVKRYSAKATQRVHAMRGLKGSTLMPHRR